MGRRAALADTHEAAEEEAVLHATIPIDAHVEEIEEERTLVLVLVIIWMVVLLAAGGRLHTRQGFEAFLAHETCR